MRDPSRDHDGSNSWAGADVSRRTRVPFARMDQMSSVSSEKTIRPSRASIATGPPTSGVEEVVREGVDVALSA
jgi:hypothetical protein